MTEQRLSRQQRRALERASKKADRRVDEYEMEPELIENPDGTITISQGTFYGRAAKWMREVDRQQ
ncbi:MAG: hypothetical protein ING69_10810 [Rhodocyclaceae bacterium]|nr:hypothetical protein [Rhodocyclaceae bacterium]